MPLARAGNNQKAAQTFASTALWSNDAVNRFATLSETGNVSRSGAEPLVTVKASVQKAEEYSAALWIR